MPVFPAYNPDGTIATYLADAESSQYGYQSIENPIATAERTQISRQGNRSTYNAYATYELIPHLTFKTNLGLQTYSEKYQYYLPSTLSNGTFPPGRRSPLRLRMHRVRRPRKKMSWLNSRLTTTVISGNMRSTFWLAIRPADFV